MKKVSMANVPLLHQVVLTIDYLRSHLEEMRDNASIHPAVCHATMNGIGILDKYYSRTDKSDMYRTAMGMYILDSLFGIAHSGCVSHASAIQTQLFCQQGVAAGMD